METNSSQSTTATRQFDAFGNPTSTTGSPAGPFGFAGGWGYQQDGDSGLKLLGHRYFDPSTGRFLTRDPGKSGRNWVAYADSSPLTSVDPTGLWNILRWIWTDDGNASDEVYNSALNQAWKTMTVWTSHFAIDNGVGATPTATTIGPLPKIIPRSLGLVRNIPVEGESWATSGIRVLSINTGSPAVGAAANTVSKYQPLIWLYYEVGLAWLATYQTYNDPACWASVEDD